MCRDIAHLPSWRDGLQTPLVYGERLQQMDELRVHLAEQMSAQDRVTPTDSNTSIHKVQFNRQLREADCAPLATSRQVAHVACIAR
jgi:hypothetical protein